MRIAKHESAYNSFIICPRGLHCKPTYIANDHRCQSSDVVRFDLGPLLQGQTRTANLKVLITCLLLILEGLDVKPTCRISWAGNLLMWSDFTLGPSFNVRRWFTGFSELSFRWIEICISSPMLGSCFYLVLHKKIKCYLRLRGLGLIPSGVYIKTS